MDNALSFWHTAIGSHLSDAPEDTSMSVLLPTRVYPKGADGKKIEGGEALVKNQRFGSCVVHYIATKNGAKIIGTLDVPSTPTVEVIGRDLIPDFRINKYLANWLVKEAEAPFMLGIVTNANPVESFKISGHETQCFYCEAGKSFSFDLEIIRHDVQVIGDFSWKAVETGLVALAAYRSAVDDVNATEEDRYKAGMALNKLFIADEGLQAVLEDLQVVVGSQEQTILRWYFA